MYQVFTSDLTEQFTYLDNGEVIRDLYRENRPLAVFLWLVFTEFSIIGAEKQKREMQ